MAKFIYLAFEDRKISLEALSSIDSMIDSVEKYIADASNPLKNSYTLESSREHGLKFIFSRKKRSYVIKNTSEDGLKIVLSGIT